MQKKGWKASRIGAAAIMLLFILLGACNVRVNLQQMVRDRPPIGTDLLAGGNDSWNSPDWSRWQFREGTLTGKTTTFPEVATDDPDAAAYLLTKQVFGGDLELFMGITFERSRYLGVYLDYDPGPVMLRLMSAVAEIERLEMRSDWVR